MHRFTVRHEALLLEYLLEEMKSQSRTTVKSYLAHRQVLLNGRVSTAFDQRLKSGDQIQIVDKGVEQQNPNSRVKIIYEDEYIIVVEKKNGLLTMSTGREGEQTAYSIVTEHVKRYARRGREQDARVFIVHRLDRDTSGLLMFAKTEEIQERLQQNWNDNVIERRYVAVCEGRLPESSGKIVSWLTENPKSLKMCSSPTDNGGKKAITNYKVLKDNGKYSLVEVTLETGRKNQIRVQLSSVGCPVAGDKRYGAATNPLGRVCLHAQTISFRHPATGEFMKFDTGIPQIFN